MARIGGFTQRLIYRPQRKEDVKQRIDESTCFLFHNIISTYFIL
ncbi:hypothetical protein IMSAGC020_01671 [Lachnospiraceae bacterium]|nr:hypothetical protein IMSAGC020_01671 [Lachnospiraceae bacterium]